MAARGRWTTTRHRRIGEPPKSLHRHAVQLATFGRSVWSASARLTSATIIVGHVSSEFGLQEQRDSDSPAPVLETSAHPVLLLGAGPPLSQRPDNPNPRTASDYLSRG